MFLYIKQIFILLCIGVCFLFRLSNVIKYLALSGGPLFIKIVQMLVQRNYLNDIQTDIQQNCTTENINELLNITKEHNIDIQIIKFIGSGSIAQTFLCKYNGENVIVKTLHPNVKRVLYVNIKIFKFIFNILQYFVRIPFKIDTIEQEFIRQCDLRNEEDNTNNIKNIMTLYNDDCSVPNIHLSYNNLLIEEYIEGWHFNEFKKLYPKYAYMAKKKTLATFLNSVLIHNTVHADCHDGNIIYNVINREEHPKYKKLGMEGINSVSVSLIDCGMVYYIDDDLKNIFFDFLHALGHGDTDKMSDIVCKLSKNITMDKKDDFSVIKKLFEQDGNRIRYMKNLTNLIIDNNIMIPNEFLIIILNILLITTDEYDNLMDDTMIYIYNYTMYDNFKKILETHYDDIDNLVINEEYTLYESNNDVRNEILNRIIV